MSENIIASQRVAEVEDQENAAAFRKKTIVNNKNPISEGIMPTCDTGDRKILGSKSSNSLKVSSSSTFGVKLSLEKSTNTSAFGRLGNANKARKVTKTPFSFFEPRKPFEAVQSGNKIGLHDSTSLQRLSSQKNSIKSFKPLSKSSTLTGDLFSSSFDKSFEESNFSSNSARRIKSQLTMSVGNDMAEFFKKSKMKEQEKFDIQVKGSENNKTEVQDETNLVDDITFADDCNDITSMTKLLTERNSPVHKRTHKVSIQNLLSSSTESDEFGETTFDFKDNQGVCYRSNALEELMLSHSKSKLPQNYIDIEFTSHKPTNAVYDETTPDVVLEGAYRSIPKPLLKNLWFGSKSVGIEGEYFEDPLSLTPAWNSQKNDVDALALSSEDIVKPGDFQLEFSDIEEESEDNEELLKIKEFYEKSG